MVSDVAALRLLVLQLAERLEICSRLLSKCAERRTCKRCEGEGNEGISRIHSVETAEDGYGRVQPFVFAG